MSTPEPAGKPGVTHLHTVWVQFPGIRHASRFLDFQEASSQGLQLIVNRQQGLRYGFRRDQECVDIGVAPPNEV